jgi:cytidylate kinase
LGTRNARSFSNKLDREEIAMNIHDVTARLAEALLRAQAMPAQRPSEEKPPFTITISREVGALGNTVADEVGKKLDWRVFNQEIIQKVSEQLGQPSCCVRDIDERTMSWFEEFLSNLSSKDQVNPSRYLRLLIGVVRGLGAMGKCIIVGRGANFILPRENTLRVRLVANLPERIVNIARSKGLCERDAARYIEKTEHERVLFVKNNFHLDPADPHHYDLIINLSSMGAEEATEVILAALHVFEKRRKRTAPKEAEALAAI